MTDKLDAYGHLNWTVGNDDWLACFDAIRRGDMIDYHVVVDCESASFVDTTEKGSIPVAEIDQLRQLPSRYADRFAENYPGEDSGWQETWRTWNAHLDSLVAAGTTPDAAEDEAEAAAAEEQSLDYFNRHIAGDR
jgi:hypothetical protein